MKKLFILAAMCLMLLSCSKEESSRGNTQDICGHNYVMPICSSNPSEVIKYYKEVGAEVSNRQEKTDVIVDVKFEPAKDVLILELHYTFFDMGNQGFDLDFTYDPSLEITVEMKQQLIDVMYADIK